MKPVKTCFANHLLTGFHEGAINAPTAVAEVKVTNRPTADICGIPILLPNTTKYDHPSFSEEQVMTDALSLVNLRTELGRTWLITLFGIAYAISQITIVVILGPIEDAMLKLQTTGVSVTDYVSVFGAWEAC
jgi:hypothetical protein